MVDLPDDERVLERLAVEEPDGVEDCEKDAEFVKLEEDERMEVPLAVIEADRDDDRVREGVNDGALVAEAVCVAELQTASNERPHVKLTPHAQNVHVVQADAPLIEE